MCFRLGGVFNTNSTVYLMFLKTILVHQWHIKIGADRSVCAQSLDVVVVVPSPSTQFFIEYWVSGTMWLTVSRASIEATLSQVENGYQDSLLLGNANISRALWHSVFWSYIPARIYIINGKTVRRTPWGSLRSSLREIKEYSIFEVYCPPADLYVCFHKQNRKTRWISNKVFHKTAVIERHPNPMSLLQGRQ